MHASKQFFTMADSALQARSAPLLPNVVQLWPPYNPKAASSINQGGSTEPFSSAAADEGRVPDSAAAAADASAPPAEAGADQPDGPPPQATHHDISHVYGEVVVDGFCAFLQSNQWLGSEAAPSTFVDLGSGAGACIAAAVASGRFALCIGIELEEDWFQCSADRFSALQKAVGSTQAESVKHSPSADGWTRFEIQQADSAMPGSCHVALKQGSMFDSEWVALACPQKQPAVVFCNATALNIPQMQQLAQVCEKLPAGSVVLTTTAALPSRLFDAQKLAERLPMSWGSSSTVHVALRKKLGKWAARMLPRY